MTGVARIRALTEAAAPEPWQTCIVNGRVDLDSRVVTSRRTDLRFTASVADAALIVALRNAAGEIADLIEAATVAARLIENSRARHELFEALRAVETRFRETA